MKNNCIIDFCNTLVPTPFRSWHKYSYNVLRTMGYEVIYIILRSFDLSEMHINNAENVYINVKGTSIMPTNTFAYLTLPLVLLPS